MRNVYRRYYENGTNQVIRYARTVCTSFSAGLLGLTIIPGVEEPGAPDDGTRTTEQSRFRTRFPLCILSGISRFNRGARRVSQTLT